MPAAVAMNTHFSHISCRMLSASRASKPALRIAAAMVSIRGDREPSSSPKLIACQSLRWTTAPSAPRVVEMAHCPPSTRSGPKRSASRSMCRMPFRSGRIAVAGPTALAKDVIAPSRSKALQLSTTRSNGSSGSPAARSAAREDGSRRPGCEWSDRALQARRPDAGERETSRRGLPAADVHRNSRRLRPLQQQEFSYHPNPI